MTELETSRRGFLKGLVAAAVATQIPNIPVAKAEAIKEALLSNLINVDGEVISTGITPMGNGWFQHWTTFIPTREGQISFGDKGVTVDEHGPIYGLDVEMDEEPYTVSAWFKAGDDATETTKASIEALTEKTPDKGSVQMWGAQVHEGEPNQRRYVNPNDKDLYIVECARTNLILNSGDFET